MTSPSSSSARLLLLIGSGELGPGMARAHRAVLERLGPDARSAFLDTPCAFQENAAEIAAKAVAYFEQRLSRPLAVASLDGEQGEDGLVLGIRRADYVFAGPGSPSYALRRWRESPVPALLAEKLHRGGALGFASAAALTLGAYTVPVYEIYKVGQPPQWLQGLDLLAGIGLRATVIPHFDNAEGGTHDTRYCYLGERRLEALERDLPADTFVLGIDEHTFLLLDLESGEAAVGGRGSVTLRAHGRSEVLPSGKSLGLGELAERAGALGSPGGPRRGTAPGGQDRTATSKTAAAPERRASQIEEGETSFRHALGERDAEALTSALLDLEQAVAATADPSSPAGSEEDPRRARLVLRSALVELAPVLAAGLEEPETVLRPYVELLVDLRARLRAERRFELADELRDRLGALGVEIGDATEGSTWRLRSGPAAGDG